MKFIKIFAPGSLCKYQFVDEEFNYLYTTERMMVRLLGIFSMLAIFIATLGIISLSTMAAENSHQRNRHPKSKRRKNF